MLAKICPFSNHNFSFVAIIHCAFLTHDRKNVSTFCVIDEFNISAKILVYLKRENHLLFLPLNRRSKYSSVDTVFGWNDLWIYAKGDADLDTICSINNFSEKHSEWSVEHTNWNHLYETFLLFFQSQLI